MLKVGHDNIQFCHQFYLKTLYFSHTIIQPINLLTNFGILLKFITFAKQ